VTDAKPGGEIEKLVKMGYVVAAADVLGIGETKNTVTNRQGTADAGYTAVLIGRSVTGIQAGDIIRVVNYLKARDEVDPSRIGAMGLNEMCIPLLHAAAFDRSINNVTLIGSPVSYRSIVMNRIYKIVLLPSSKKLSALPHEVDFNTTIARILTAYDIPDLIGCIAPRKVALTDLKDHSLATASEDLINEEMAFPRSVYSNKGVSDNLKILSSSETAVNLVDWCFR
jgi:hypothetical protein